MSDFLSGAGLLIAAAGAAASILLPAGRLRSAAMLTALVLFPLLILGDQWHTHRIVDLRHHEGKAAAAIVLGAVLVIALAWVFRRWPVLMPLAIIGTLPFRIPLEMGRSDEELLSFVEDSVRSQEGFVSRAEWSAGMAKKIQHAHAQ